MNSHGSVDDRAKDILHDIVETYIAQGEPVASRALSRHSRHALSAASIRGVMADLSDDGYLDQPHTSAGRIPTQKAFRSYVSSLVNRKLAMSEVSRIRHELTRLDTVEERLECSSHMLTEMTRNVGIAAAIPGAGQTLDQIELVRLEERRVLMIVATRDHIVRNRVVSLGEPVAAAELESIRNYVNRNFSGWRLPDIQTELLRRLEAESAAYDANLRKLAELYQKGLLEIGLAPEVHMEGASYLVGLDLRMTRDKLEELFHALEEKKRILDLLDRFLDAQPAGQFAAQVGLEEVHSSMNEMSLVGVRVQLPSGLTAKMAVLGPMRMNYGRVISAVMHLGQAFQHAQA